MTTEATETDTLGFMTASELVDEVARCEEVADAASQALYEAQEMLRWHMQQNGAREAVSGTHKAVLTPKYEYQPEVLVQLLDMDDIVTTKELTDAGAYRPEHDKTVTVPAKWDARKLGAFGRRGNQISDVIANAKRPLRPALKVGPR